LSISIILGASIIVVSIAFFVGFHYYYKKPRDDPDIDIGISRNPELVNEVNNNYPNLLPLQPDEINL